MSVYSTHSLPVILLLFISGLSHAQNTQTAILSVTVDGLRNNKGVVQFSLYNKKGSIPDEHFTQYLSQQAETIKNKSSSTVFKNLPIGQYAINILHDENNDGKINKGFMLPTEGIGFSNYSTINLFNRPDFKGARIQLNTDTSIEVNIIYF